MKLSHITIFLLFAFSSFIIFNIFNFKESGRVIQDYNLSKKRSDVFKSRVKVYENSWLRDINSYLKIEDKNNLKILIVFSENKDKGCTMCFKWEVEWWVKFISENKLDSAIDVVAVLSDCENLEKMKQSLKVCQVELPIVVDSESKILEDLSIEWSPAVIFTYKNLIIYHYISDMNNRDKSKQFMKKCITFIDLINE